ncbi:TIGR01212 family radical SAM protein [uncultured Anaerococcus sp.]|uniref:TIGR01212 family radical SAM protein n=1 Tax=uncultured Anaerococcus sp. TaxID=293428 RepID=UPI00288A177B|nr:TIGR01212 family radical SAM protein [uncultured Anaerococcus sp.]
MADRTYYKVSDYYKDTYNEKVYKLPVKLPLTCPNRDGACGYGGCIYCSETGGSFENLDSSLSVDEQLIKNKDYISNKYKANKFIAYFQNFSNTYMSLEEFKKIISSCNKDFIVGISIATRSDCITEDKLDFLKNWKNQTGIDITIELGLQTANYKTLKILNRGESLADFIFACNLINKYGFRISTHVILALPWDDINDTIETARILNALNVKEVKIHSLFIAKNTKLGLMYEQSLIKLKSKEEYQKNVIEFLRYIDPDCAIARLVGRAPKEDTIFCNWDRSWWLIRDEIVSTMKDAFIKQGDKSKQIIYEKIKGDKL